MNPIKIRYLELLYKIINTSYSKNAQIFTVYKAMISEKESNMANFIKFVMWVVLSFWCSTTVSQPNYQQVPGLFIFGDSLVDNGNNNGLLTLARANYRPYGIDFPQGTTGRFTNGRTFVDALGSFFFTTVFFRCSYLIFKIALTQSLCFQLSY